MNHALDPQTERVLDALRVAVRRDHRRRRRRTRTAALALALFAVSGAAVAGTQDWWTDAPPATDQPVVDAQLNERDMEGRPHSLADPALARTVARAPGATLVAAPTHRGGYCLLPQLPREPGASVVGAGLGFACGFAPGASDTRAASTFMTLAAESAGAERLYVYGRITHPAAEAVDLSAVAGEPLRIPLRADGFFMETLPRAAWQRLDDLTAEVAILDGDGRSAQQACVSFGPSPLSRIGRTADGGGRLEPAPCFAEGRRSSAPPRPTPVAPAPALVGTDAFTGKPFALADFAGHPFVIQFWERNVVPDSPGATHGVARSSLDELYLLAEQRPELGIRFVAVSEDPRGLAAQDRRNVPDGFVHVRDRREAIARAFGVERFPTLLFLDAQHRIRAEIVGVPTQSELMRGVRLARDAE